MEAQKVRETHASGYDPLIQAVAANPYPHYAVVRKEAPVKWIESMQGFAVSRWEDVFKVLSEPKIFSSAQFWPALLGEYDPVPEVAPMISLDPPGHLRIRKLASKVFVPSRVGADAICMPTTTQQVSEIIALCNSARQPVVVHGGMSGWVRATQTKPGEIALSLERMSAIESVDTANRTAVVQAGVVLEALQKHLEQFELCFPLDLGGRGSCQIGGNASTNAGGMRVIRYGMMRDQILGVEAVLADGRIVSSLNHMIKNNTGYDLKQLFIGSEGTLGVITRLVLRLETPHGCIAETVAILEYLEEALPKPAMYPSDRFLRARARQLINVMQMYVEAQARSLFPGVFFGLENSQTMVAATRLTLDRATAALRLLMRPNPFLFGAAISHADVFAFYCLDIADRVTRFVYSRSILREIGTLTAWTQTMASRPSSRAVFADFYPALVAYLEDHQAQYDCRRDIADVFVPPAAVGV